ncbi:MAG: type 4a pilus biogenesis protein PilO [Myxococcota bacterium]
MERFEALPTPQKLLIGFLVLALAGGGFYFLMISDAEAAITAAKSQVRQNEQKIAQLKKYESGELLRALEAEEAELQEQLAANKALLPEEEKLPALITSIKRQADERGLKINLFKKRPRFPDEYVDIIPVEMEVEGSFPVVVSFFEALAQPGMRMMTVSGLDMEALDVKSIMDERRVEEQTSMIPGTGISTGQKVDKKNLTPTEHFLMKLDKYEGAVDRMRVKSKFTVNAYSYTGKLLTAEQRKKRKSGTRSIR